MRLHDDAEFAWRWSRNQLIKPGCSCEVLSPCSTAALFERRMRSTEKKDDQDYDDDDEKGRKAVEEKQRWSWRKREERTKRTSKGRSGQEEWRERRYGEGGQQARHTKGQSEQIERSEGQETGGPTPLLVAQRSREGIETERASLLSERAMFKTKSTQDLPWDGGGEMCHLGPRTPDDATARRAQGCACNTVRCSVGAARTCPKEPK